MAVTRHQMIVAFDVGNSTVKCAVGRFGDWQRILRVSTEPPENLADRLVTAFLGARDSEHRGATCVCASVQPQANRAVAEAWRRLAGDEVLMVGPDLAVPLPMRVDEPQTVGVDRLLVALAARKALGAPCAVVSAGTAITVDLVDRDGAFAGGAIMPGLRLAAEALSSRTALLPLVEVPVSPSIPGTDTVSALQAGIYCSATGGASLLLDHYARSTDRPGLPVAVTGSDAHLLLGGLPARTRHLPHLLYDAMATVVSHG